LALIKRGKKKERKERNLIVINLQEIKGENSSNFKNTFTKLSFLQVESSILILITTTTTITHNNNNNPLQE
jgi:hypothetical protein